jgi:hypothetical protein
MERGETSIVRAGRVLTGGFLLQLARFTGSGCAASAWHTEVEFLDYTRNNGRAR